MRTNYHAVRNSWSGLSNLLRSGFVRNVVGPMWAVISGLKPSRMYLLKTYHHSSSHPDGGTKFLLEFNQDGAKKMQQSNNGQNPNPPLIVPQTVFSGEDG